MDGDLVAFLAARLDEDEAAAKAAEGRPEFDGTGIVIQRNQGGDRSVVMPSHVATHIARHDPARVLREVVAKRAILAEHRPSYPVTYPKPSGQPTCSVCDQGSWDTDPMPWPCPTVRHLATIYDGHPGYRDEWKP